MEKDHLQKDLQREIRRFRMKRRFLQMQIFCHRQRLKFTAFTRREVHIINEQIENLGSAVEQLEDEVRETIFYRLYLREV